VQYFQYYICFRLLHYYFGNMFAVFQDESDGIVTSGVKHGDKGEAAKEPADGEAQCETFSRNAIAMYPHVSDEL
jgi:hypothetical protein